MSTDYYLTCSKCKKYLMCYTRQAWGWGNYDALEAIAFLMKHTNTCFVYSIGACSEDTVYDLDGYEEENFTDEDKEYYTPLKALKNIEKNE